MAGLRVPEIYRQGLQTLGKLSTEDMKRLMEVVNTQDAMLRSRDWVGQVAGRIEGVPVREVRDIADAVMSLYSVQSYLSLTVEEIAEQIAESSDLDLPMDSRSDLRSRLVALLSSQSLRITSKALGVLSEEERRFHDARIVTEIRPIFLDDPSARPSAATIVHLLKIEYHQDAELKEFYVLLTEGGTSKLKELLDRADKKWHSLRSLMDELKLPVLGEEN